MVKHLPYFTLKTPPKSTALLKQAFSDFIVKEDLGYEMSGEGEFVAVKIRKTDCNTLFVGEKLAKFAGVSERHMGYAGLKDRHGITEQWFCLQMPGKETPDFSQFKLEGVEILDVTRHNRKIRTGSLQGNTFEILLRGAKESDELNERLDFVAKYGFPNYFTEQRFGRDGHNLTQAIRWAKGEIKVHNRKIRTGSLQGNDFEILLRGAKESDELNERLNFVAKYGFPNYFTEQRFGRDGHNLTQAIRWAKGEIKVKDRKKRSFYLSAARSEIFNLVVAERIEQNVADQVLRDDIVQLNGSHSWFKADENEDLVVLQQRLNEQDILLTAPLIGEENLSASAVENKVVLEHQIFQELMKQERMKAARRPLLMQAKDFHWTFVEEGLKLSFYLPAGSYATALVRELVNIKEEE